MKAPRLQCLACKAAFPFRRASVSAAGAGRAGLAQPVAVSVGARLAKFSDPSCFREGGFALTGFAGNRKIVTCIGSLFSLDNFGRRLKGLRMGVSPQAAYKARGFS